MKTTEVNESLIGKRCECVSFGSRVTGQIISIEEDDYCVRVNIHLDTPQRWGEYLYPEEWLASATSSDHSKTCGFCPNPKSRITRLVW